MMTGKWQTTRFKYKQVYTKYSDGKHRHVPLITMDSTFHIREATQDDLVGSLEDRTSNIPTSQSQDTILELVKDLVIPS